MKKVEIFPIENYKRLACAIILKAIEDFSEDDFSEDELKDFLYGAEWIQCLNLDVDVLLEKAYLKRKIERRKKCQRKEQRRIRRINGQQKN